jgi:hypothetical protein
MYPIFTAPSSQSASKSVDFVVSGKGFEARFRLPGAELGARASTSRRRPSLRRIFGFIPYPPSFAGFAGRRLERIIRDQRMLRWCDEKRVPEQDATGQAPRTRSPRGGGQPATVERIGRIIQPTSSRARVVAEWSKDPTNRCGPPPSDPSREAGCGRRRGGRRTPGPGASTFCLQICGFWSGGTRIRTGDTMIFLLAGNVPPDECSGSRRYALDKPTSRAPARGAEGTAPPEGGSGSSRILLERARFSQALELGAKQVPPAPLLWSPWMASKVVSSPQ